YDTLFEDAWHDVLGWSASSFDDYVRGPVKLVKPHGSVNWTREAGPLRLFREGWESSPEFATEELVTNAADLVENQRFRISLTEDPRRQNETTGESVGLAVPALSIPVDDKSDLILPNNHNEELVWSLRQAIGLLTIGWRAT